MDQLPKIQHSSWFDKIIARLACLRGLHAPDRGRVRKERLYYTAHCQACGAPIRKRNGTGWKRYTPNSKKT